MHVVVCSGASASKLFGGTIIWRRDFPLVSSKPDWLSPRGTGDFLLVRRSYARVRPSCKCIHPPTAETHTRGFASLLKLTQTDKTDREQKADRRREKHKDLLLLPCVTTIKSHVHNPDCFGRPPTRLRVPQARFPKQRGSVMYEQSKSDRARFEW